MVIGPFINAGAVLAGGVLGALLSHRLPERVRVSMPPAFGLCSLGIGVLLTIKCVNLPVMVLATLIGTLIGELCYVEKGLGGAINGLKKIAQKKKPRLQASGTHENFVNGLVTLIILFCTSGTGVFGAMHEGITGDASILIAKSFLDFFSAVIFATSLGIAVSAIAIPMLAIQLLLASCSTLILPLTTPTMMSDFSAVGGVLLLAIGLRMGGIKMIAVANMLPALIIAMPLSALWTTLFA
ncbi:TPA: DUF554 domain-containing protein [Salmonella enterica]|nr:DUF554 domain-containing protein [Salmonella enterica]